MGVHDSRTALIVGAGIGGLAAGVALRRAGWSVRIYERAASARELGFGLLLAPNALSALREMGIAGAIANGAGRASAVEIRRLNGRVIRRFEIPTRVPAVVALRTELHGALLAALGTDAVRLGSEAVSFDENVESVTLRLRNGNTDTGHVLIGADGVGSAIRRQLHPDEPPP